MNTTPIEFMAWDEEYNEILTSWFVIFDGMVYRDERCFEYGNDTNKVHLMQLTALRSINDEPIYNHMIVKDNYGSFYLVDLHNYLWMFKLKCMELEIVGNRFQSPELLELCK